MLEKQWEPQASVSDMKRPLLANCWRGRAENDPRFDGLVRLANVICDVWDFTESGCSVETFVPPMELARLLRAAADQIEEQTRK